MKEIASSLSSFPAMEEPLLGRSLKSIEPLLWTIPEDTQVAESPALLKERIVYGSLGREFLGSFEDDDTAERKLLHNSRYQKAEEVEDDDMFYFEGIESRPPVSSREQEQAERPEKQQKTAVPHRRHLKKSRTAPAMTVAYSKSSTGVRKPQLESAGYIVRQAAVGLLIYLTVGVLIYMWRGEEFSGSTTFPLVDALYFSIVTLCTIGYGDITPVSSATKLYCCVSVLVGLGFIDMLLSGMVAYILQRQETLLMSAVEGGHHETAKRYLVNSKEGRMRKRMKVVLAVVVVISCLAFGAVAMHVLEHLNWLDAFYASCMSVTTVGYGDHAFKSLHGRLFASIWLLVSSLAVARAFLFLAEARIERRSRSIAKWVMKREMTIGDLVAADIDNDGYVSKSEYVVYKLRELGKISDEDIMEVCCQFNLLDTDNSGRITLSCLGNAV